MAHCKNKENLMEKTCKRALCLRMLTMYYNISTCGKGDIMKLSIPFYIVLTIFAGYFPCNALVIPYLNFHSQGINGARELVGWQTQINKFDVNSLYGSFSITPEYTRSFREYQIATYLWCDALAPEYDYTINMKGCCNDPLIRIQGTKASDRSQNALMAENFYLPTDFKSEVRFHPVIENYLVDFNFYLGLDNWAPGLYFRIHTPLCHTGWNMHMHEHVIHKGTFNYDPGYFNDTFTGSGTEPYKDTQAYGIDRTHMLANFSEYIQDGKSITGIDGIRYEGLKQARIARHTLTKTRLAEITAAFGWNFWTSEDYHFGINIRAAAPTGNSPQGQWLFEPIVGNGHHWELGAGITSHVCLVRGETIDKNLSFYLDGYFSHLFSTRQCRTFDLCGSPLSRYMLAMKFTDSAQNLRAGNISMPYAQDNHFIPLANISTIPVKVNALFQGEFLFKLAYTYKRFQMDIGYDLWARSSENIKPCGKTELDNALWAIKGDAFTYGFEGISTEPGNFTVNQPGIPLSATESDANIFRGTNNYPDGLSIDGAAFTWNENPGINNPRAAYSSDRNNLFTHQIGSTVPSATYAWEVVSTSSLPCFITSKKLGFDRASTKSYSQKFFIHANYTLSCNNWSPYIGIGGEIEFGDQGNEFGCAQCRKQCCNASCAQGACPGNSCCTSCGTSCTLGQCRTGGCCTGKAVSCEKQDNATVSLSQFGIWIKGGFSF